MFRSIQRLNSATSVAQEGRTAWYHSSRHNREGTNETSECKAVQAVPRSYLTEEVPARRRIQSSSSISCVLSTQCSCSDGSYASTNDIVALAIKLRSACRLRWARCRQRAVAAAADDGSPAFATLLYVG